MSLSTRQILALMYLPDMHKQTIISLGESVTFSLSDSQLFDIFDRKPGPHEFIDNRSYANGNNTPSLTPLLANTFAENIHPKQNKPAAQDHQTSKPEHEPKPTHKLDAQVQSQIASQSLTASQSQITPQPQIATKPQNSLELQFQAQPGKVLQFTTTSPTDGATNAASQNNAENLAQTASFNGQASFNSPHSLAQPNYAPHATYARRDQLQPTNIGVAMYINSDEYELDRIFAKAKSQELEKQELKAHELEEQELGEQELEIAQLKLEELRGIEIEEQEFEELDELEGLNELEIEEQNIIKPQRPQDLSPRAHGRSRSRKTHHEQKVRKKHNARNGYLKNDIHVTTDAWILNTQAQLLMRDNILQPQFMPYSKSLYWAKCSVIQRHKLPCSLKPNTIEPEYHRQQEQAIEKEQVAKLRKQVPRHYSAKQLEMAFNQAHTVLFHSRQQGIHAISYFEDDYPQALREALDEHGCPAPAILLFCKGNLDLLHAPRKVAIIGSRTNTPLGGIAATAWAGYLAKEQTCIVSGLALGCDAAAHRGALKAQHGKTLAILAHGLDQVYPPEHKSLANIILKHEGLLVSEYPLGTNISSRSFIARDRLQAALSSATIVVQSKAQSGTLHAAKTTYQLNHPLFVIRYTQSEDGLSLETRGNHYLEKNYGAIPLSAYVRPEQMATDVKQVLDTVDDFNRKQQLHNQARRIQQPLQLSAPQPPN